MNIEALAKMAGMDCALNQGSGSCVSSDGCNGVTQEHLERFAELVATAATAELQSRLNGALSALKDFRSFVPPKDWKPYWEHVLEANGPWGKRSNCNSPTPTVG